MPGADGPIDDEPEVTHCEARGSRRCENASLCARPVLSCAQGFSATGGRLRRYRLIFAGGELVLPHNDWMRPGTALCAGNVDRTREVLRPDGCGDNMLLGQTYKRWLSSPALSRATAELRVRRPINHNRRPDRLAAPSEQLVEEGLEYLFQDGGRPRGPSGSTLHARLQRLHIVPDRGVKRERRLYCS